MTAARRWQIAGVVFVVAGIIALVVCVVLFATGTRNNWGWLATVVLLVSTFCSWRAIKLFKQHTPPEVEW